MLHWPGPPEWQCKAESVRDAAPRHQPAAQRSLHMQQWGCPSIVGVTLEVACTASHQEPGVTKCACSRTPGVMLARNLCRLLKTLCREMKVTNRATTNDRNLSSWFLLPSLPVIGHSLWALRYRDLKRSNMQKHSFFLLLIQTHFAKLQLQLQNPIHLLTDKQISTACLRQALKI